jgi:prepilin-type N-terminal cleavage/methylation domain-containing protein
MTNVHASTRRSEQGFTLVELAIVMVIIGLLIGGILKGQELISNAKVSSTVTQLKGLDAALNTFQDKYNALAGDMNNTQTRLPGGQASENGDGNGRINQLAGAAPAAGAESTNAFVQLSRADLISGVNVNGGLAAGGIIPEVKAGGTMWLGTASNAGAGTGGIATLNANKTYASLNGQTAAVAAGTGAIAPDAAAQIDRKLDDGTANTGTVQAVCGAGAITGGVYNENIENAPCALYVRVNN